MTDRSVQAVCRYHGRASTWIVIALVFVAAIAAVAVLSRTIDLDGEPARTADEVTDERLLIRFLEDLNTAVTDERSAAVVVTNLEAYVGRYPENADAWRALGQARAYEDDPVGAYEAFAQSLKLDAEQPEIAVLAGTFAKGLERFDESEAWYQSAIDQQPDVIGHRRHLATLHEHRGDLPKARAILEDALERSPNHVEVMLQLAGVLEAGGHREAALELLQKAVARSVLMSAERRGVVAVRYADLMLERGEVEQARQALEALPASEQIDHDVMERLAICWQHAGEPTLAAKRYETRLLLHPDDDRAAAAAVRWWLEAGDVDKARTALVQLREIAPRHEQFAELSQAVEQSP